MGGISRDKGELEEGVRGQQRLVKISESLKGDQQGHGPQLRFMEQFGELFDMSCRDGYPCPNGHDRKHLCIKYNSY